MYTLLHTEYYLQSTVLVMSAVGSVVSSISRSLKKKRIVIMIIYGNPVEVPAHLNFGKYILDGLRNVKPDNVCLQNSSTGEKITVIEFLQHAVNLSVALSELGVKKGDIVGVGSEKRSLFLPTALAVVFIGAVYTPFELRCGRASLKYKLSLVRPKYFITSQLFWEANESLLKDLVFIKTFIGFDDIKDIKLSLRTLISRQVDVASFEPAFILGGQKDTALILYSSGTTGMPKAVELTHLSCIFQSKPNIRFEDNILKNAFVLGEWCDVYDIFATFKYICSGWKVLYMKIDTPDAVIKCIQEYQVSFAVIVPSMVACLAEAAEINKSRFSSLKIIYCAGSHLNAKTIQAIEEKFPISTRLFQGYGSSETGPCTTYTLNNCIKKGSVGMAYPGVSLKVVDLETRRMLGPNQRGVICVRSPGVMKGYAGINVATLQDEQGFYFTGDVGYFDEDHYFYFVDRLKDIFKYEGNQVCPLELETILQLHPGVREVGVVGRPAGDLGELPTAFVVRQLGANVCERDLVDFVTAEVPPYMQLRGGVYFVSKLPKNSRGKVIRRRLKEMLG